MDRNKRNHSFVTKVGIGFDQYLDLITNVDDTTTFDDLTKLPPYNIIKTSDTTYRLDVALLGVDKQDIVAVLDAEALSISATVAKGYDYSAAGDYFHKGIFVGGAFKAKFLVAKNLALGEANLVDGILSITFNDVTQPRAVETIAIGPFPVPEVHYDVTYNAAGEPVYVASKPATVVLVTPKAPVETPPVQPDPVAVSEASPVAETPSPDPVPAQPEPDQPVESVETSETPETTVETSTTPVETPVEAPAAEPAPEAVSLDESSEVTASEPPAPEPAPVADPVPVDPVEDPAATSEKAEEASSEASNQGTPESASEPTESAATDAEVPADPVPTEANPANETIESSSTDTPAEPVTPDAPSSVEAPVAESPDQSALVAQEASAPADQPAEQSETPASSTEPSVTTEVVAESPAPVEPAPSTDPSPVTPEDSGVEQSSETPPPASADESVPPVVVSDPAPVAEEAQPSPEAVPVDATPVVDVAPVVEDRSPAATAETSTDLVPPQEASAEAVPVVAEASAVVESPSAPLVTEPVVGNETSITAEEPVAQAESTTVTVNANDQSKPTVNVNIPTEVPQVVEVGLDHIADNVTNSSPAPQATITLNDATAEVKSDDVTVSVVKTEDPTKADVVVAVPNDVAQKLDEKGIDINAAITAAVNHDDVTVQDAPAAPANPEVATVAVTPTLDAVAAPPVTIDVPQTVTPVMAAEAEKKDDGTVAVTLKPADADVPADAKLVPVITPEGQPDIVVATTPDAHDAIAATGQDPVQVLTDSVKAVDVKVTADPPKTEEASVTTDAPADPVSPAPVVEPAPEAAITPEAPVTSTDPASNTPDNLVQQPEV